MRIVVGEPHVDAILASGVLTSITLDNNVIIHRGDQGWTMEDSQGTSSVTRDQVVQLILRRATR
jgi:hypothetical protein